MSKLNKILGTFTKVQKDLVKFIKESEVQEDRYTSTIQDLDTKRDDVVLEKNRANAVLSKLNDFVGI